MTCSKLWLYTLGALLCCSVGCKNEPEEASPEDDATLGVKDYVASEIEALHQSAKQIQAAAPKPDADGWNAQDDADAIEDMRAAWADARDHYERVEGAIAVLFPELDASTDERYDGFIEEEADDDLFDGEGVTGVHAIERILWAGEHSQKVIDFESALDGYVAASMPSTEAEAEAFKNELCERLVADTEQMRDEFEPQALDSAAAFRGVIGSMQEQIEKVTLAASAEDESRYAQRTLDDMRANLEGGRETYSAFRAWVKADGGEDLDADIIASFEDLEALYADIDGAAIPAVPEGFDLDDPSEADLDTEYGKLWSGLNAAADPDMKGSLASQMLEAADALGIPQLPE